MRSAVLPEHQNLTGWQNWLSHTANVIHPQTNALVLEAKEAKTWDKSLEIY